jgi:glyoxylase-like metal-dependent hydrolase (beta-lactamase superfamily II)
VLVVRRAQVGPLAQNAYLAACDRTGEAVLVDPGAEAARVLALCEPGGLQVRRIFLTHGHPDHVGAAAAAKAATGAPVTVHRGDDPWIRHFEESALMLGLDGSKVPPVDLRHEDGETFQVGEQPARVIHTPGHTAGGCCLFFPDAKVLFTGDTLMSGTVGRTDLLGGDLDALITSIRDRLFTLGDEVRFHPGHGPSGLLGDERRTNPFAGISPSTRRRRCSARRRRGAPRP